MVDKSPSCPPNPLSINIDESNSPISIFSNTCSPYSSIVPVNILLSKIKALTFFGSKFFYKISNFSVLLINGL